MAWRPQPRRIRVDGTDAVLLPQDDYERLDAIRRRAGAQASRIHALREQLADAVAALESIRHAAGRAECAHYAHEHATRCLRDEVLAILASDAAPGRYPHKAETDARPEQDQIS